MSLKRVAGRLVLQRPRRCGAPAPCVAAASLALIAVQPHPARVRCRDVSHVPGVCVCVCVSLRPQGGAQRGNTHNMGSCWPVLGIIRIIFYYYNTGIKYSGTLAGLSAFRSRAAVVVGGNVAGGVGIFQCPREFFEKKRTSETLKTTFLKI